MTRFKRRRPRIKKRYTNNKKKRKKKKKNRWLDHKSTRPPLRKYTLAPVADFGCKHISICSTDLKTLVLNMKTIEWTEAEKTALDRLDYKDSSWSCEIWNHITSVKTILKKKRLYFDNVIQTDGVSVSLFMLRPKNKTTEHDVETTKTKKVCCLKINK